MFPYSGDNIRQQQAVSDAGLNASFGLHGWVSTDVSSSRTSHSVTGTNTSVAGSMASKPSSVHTAATTTTEQSSVFIAGPPIMSTGFAASQQPAMSHSVINLFILSFINCLSNALHSGIG